MKNYGAKELADSFRTVRKNTVVVAEDIGEEHYGFSPAEGSRTVAQSLVHIAMAPRIQRQIHGIERRTKLAGFDFGGILTALIAEEKTARSKAEIVALLKESGEEFAQWLGSLQEDFLDETVTMPPGMTPLERSRFEMILSVKEHEMHHRGQLMLVERMLGVTPHVTREMNARLAAMQSQKATA